MWFQGMIARCVKGGQGEFDAADKRSCSPDNLITPIKLNTDYSSQGLKLKQDHIDPTNNRAGDEHLLGHLPQ